MDPEMSMNLKQLMELCKENPAILNHPSIVLFRDFLLSMGDKLPPAANITEESPQPYGEDSDLMAASSDPDIMSALQDGSSEEEGQDEMEGEPSIRLFPENMSLEQMINELEKEKDNRIHKRTVKSVIAFIEEIEKAYQYFMFKEQLRKDKSIKYDSPKDNLVEEQVEKFKFDKLDKEDIQAAVNAYLSELNEEYCFGRRTGYLKDYKKFVLGKWDDDNYIYTDEDKRYMEVLFPCSSLENPEILDQYAFLDPIFKLVYGVLRKRHTMDQNPLKELQKIIVGDSSSLRFSGSQFSRVLFGIPRPTSYSGADPVSTGEEADDLSKALTKYRELILALEDGLESDRISTGALTKYRELLLAREDELYQVQGASIGS